jgi:hypothetical protein
VYRWIRRVTARRFVVAQNDTRLAEYLVEYTIALLPDVKEEDFKPGQPFLNDGSFQLTEPHFAAFDLEHRFLKRVRSKDDPDQYVWQIRILEISSRTVNATEDAIFERLQEEVSRTLAPFGIPVSRAILKEIAAASSR